MEQSERQNHSTKTDAQTCVLIVEDEPSAREASELYLGRLGYCVATASNAAEALQQAATHAPDIAVCDWRLGDGPDGVEVARQLQQRYKTPIVFVTAHPIDELREASEDINVSRYLRKPISLPTLAKTIATVAG
ncbi:MAG: response regulator [Gammaproteobacteria bacterium]|nr:response regulator [Gammaproteobacteria bacterium]